MKAQILVLCGLFSAACNVKGTADRERPVSRAEKPALPSDPPPLAAAKQAAVGAKCEPACSSIERCAEAQCVPNCPAGEVYVPATGSKGFTMGRGKKSEKNPAHRVVLSSPFCMDTTEVTVSAYRACVEAGKCTLPELRDLNSNYRPEYHRDNHPVNLVNWMQAMAYCASRGQTLPTEAEWEWAASHGDGRRYPWGDEPDPTCENNYADFTPGGAPKSDPAGDVGCHGGGTSEVKAHPKGKTTWPNGDIFDLAGNVWEWTADCYLPYTAADARDPSPQTHPAVPGDCWVRVLRGGGWNRSNHGLFTFTRGASRRTYRVPGLGFRCIRKP